MTEDFDEMTEEKAKEKERRKRATAAYAEAIDYSSGTSHAEPPAEASPRQEEEPIVEATVPVEPEKKAPIETSQVEPLTQELEQLRQKASEYFEGWQRERADFANYRKRIERDQSQMTQTITGNLIKKYLVVCDDLERALRNRPVQGEGASWADGVELIYRKLQNIIEMEGIQPVPEDLEFNPTYHEAISHEESPDHESGQIIEIVQKGYTLGDRVLRPAQVRVAR